MAAIDGGFVLETTCLEDPMDGAIGDGVVFAGAIPSGPTWELRNGEFSSTLSAVLLRDSLTGDGSVMTSCEMAKSLEVKCCR